MGQIVAYSYSGLSHSRIWQNNAFLNPPLKYVHILIPGMWEYAMLQSKRDFTAVITLSILRWGSILNYGPSVITEIFTSERVNVTVMQYDKDSARHCRLQRWKKGT